MGARSLLLLILSVGAACGGVLACARGCGPPRNTLVLSPEPWQGPLPTQPSRIPLALAALVNTRDFKRAEELFDREADWTYPDGEWDNRLPVRVALRGKGLLAGKRTKLRITHVLWGFDNVVVRCCIDSPELDHPLISAWQLSFKDRKISMIENFLNPWPLVHKGDGATDGYHPVCDIDGSTMVNDEIQNGAQETYRALCSCYLPQSRPCRELLADHVELIDHGAFALQRQVFGARGPGRSRLGSAQRERSQAHKSVPGPHYDGRGRGNGERCTMLTLSTALNRRAGRYRGGAWTSTCSKGAGLRESRCSGIRPMPWMRYGEGSSHASKRGHG